MNDLLDFLNMLRTLGEKPSRRRWLNWLVWGLAILGIVIAVAYYGLTLSHWLTGWPAS